jgi:hypothetical protein
MQEGTSESDGTARSRIPASTIPLRGRPGVSRSTCVGPLWDTRKLCGVMGRTLRFALGRSSVPLGHRPGRRHSCRRVGASGASGKPGWLTVQAGSW